jgi:dihydrofolate reductase
MDELGAIGKNSKLPWHLSTDLKRFKRLTMGHSIIMGRKTFESIGKPLPGRTNIIVTRQEDYGKRELIITNSLESALDIARKTGEYEVFIIGGGEIFKHSIAYIDKIYLTLVLTQIADADTFFPEIDWTQFRLVEMSHHLKDAHNDFATRFEVWERIPQG